MADVNNEMGVSVKLFLGFHLDSEIKSHLFKSKPWQLSTVLDPSERKLIEVHHKGQDYIGRFLTQDRLLIDELRQNDKLAKEALKNFCPNCNLDGLAVCVFPQVFVE